MSQPLVPRLTHYFIIMSIRIFVLNIILVVVGIGMDFNGLRGFCEVYSSHFTCKTKRIKYVYRVTFC